MAWNLKETVEEAGIVAERESCAFAVETVSGFGDPGTIEACARAVRDRSEPGNREPYIHMTPERFAHLCAVERAFNAMTSGELGALDAVPRLLGEMVRLRAAMSQATEIMRRNFQKPSSEWSRARVLLETALDAPISATRVRHLKRGTTYTVLAHGELQDAAGKGLPEGAALVVYAGDDGRVWLRSFCEFMDGRFEALPTGEMAS